MGLFDRVNRSGFCVGYNAYNAANAKALGLLFVANEGPSDKAVSDIICGFACRYCADVDKCECTLAQQSLCNSAWVRLNGRG